MPDPFLMGGAIVLLGAGLPGRGVSGGGPVARADLESLQARAVFPLPKWGEYLPTISQGYHPDSGAYSHHGVDCMYRRQGGSGAPDLVFPSGTINGSRGHFCPPGTRVLAIADGYVWNAGKGPTGGYVTIDHGAPWASFYVHLEQLAFPELQRGAGRIAVKAGQVIGTAGGSPVGYALRHLHFELWYKGGSAAHVDPWHVIKDAPVVAPIGG